MLTFVWLKIGFTSWSSRGVQLLAGWNKLERIVSLYLCSKNRLRRKAELTNRPSLVDNLYDKDYVTGSRDNSESASFTPWSPNPGTTVAEWWEGAVLGFSEVDKFKINNRSALWLIHRYLLVIDASLALACIDKYWTIFFSKRFEMDGSEIHDQKSWLKETKMTVNYANAIEYRYREC